MTQHTPERWYVGKSSTEDLAIRVQLHDEEDEQDLCIAVVLPIVDGQGEAEQKANARLIAKAPEQEAIIEELLEASRDVVKKWLGATLGGTIAEIAVQLASLRAAIVKAETSN